MWLPVTKRLEDEARDIENQYTEQIDYETGRIYRRYMDGRTQDVTPEPQYSPFDILRPRPQLPVQPTEQPQVFRPNPPVQPADLGKIMALPVGQILQKTQGKYGQTPEQAYMQWKPSGIKLPGTENPVLAALSGMIMAQPAQGGGTELSPKSAIEALPWLAVPGGFRGAGKIPGAVVEKAKPLAEAIYAGERGSMFAGGKITPLEQKAVTELNTFLTEVKGDIPRIQSAIDDEVRLMETELGNRSMPFHGGAKNKYFPNVTTNELEARWKVYKDFQSTLPEQTPTLPVQEPGMPEAGIQKGIFGEEKVVHPEPAKFAKMTQAEMDDYLRLQQYKERVTPEVPIEKPKIEQPVMPETLKSGAQYEPGGLYYQEIERTIAGKKPLVLLESSDRIKAENAGLKIIATENTWGFKESSLIGYRPENEKMALELKRVLETASADDMRAHIRVGRLLGYSEEDIKRFITNWKPSEKYKRPPKPSGIAPELKTTPLTEGGGIKPPEVPPTGVTSKESEFAGNIRLSKFPEEVQPDLKTWAEDISKVELRRRGVRPHEVTLESAQEIANKTGGDPAKIAKRLGQAYNAEEAKAIDGMLIQAQDELKQVKSLIDVGQDTTGNLLRMKQSQDKLSYWVALATSARAEAGRALESFKIVNKAIKSNDTKVMEAVLKRVGGRDNLEKVIEASRGLDWNNPVAINNFIRQMNKPQLKDYIFEVYVNSILSGPKTHIVNTLSNALNAVVSPIETLGGAIAETGLAKIQRRTPTRFIGEARYEAAGALSGFRDGVRGAFHTIKYGVRPEAISKYEFRPSAFKGKLGRTINFPVTALEAADELFYNVNYRMALNKFAYRASKARGLQKQKLFEDMADMVANPTDDIIQQASKQAEYRLFRQPAGKSTQRIMGLREDIPPLKFFVPFLRTPTNLVKFGMERSPLGFFNPKLIKNLAAKNPEAADQLARAFIGTVVATALYFYVKDGNIIGGAPTNASQRDKFYAEGKQPYSIKIGDSWVSYQRLEPFNQMLSQLVALVDAVNQGDDKTIQDRLGIVAKDIGQNFISQTYMSGLSDIFDAIADPERYGTYFIQRTAGSLAVPYSAASRTIAQQFDPTIRQPTNIWESIQANIPGMSQNVPAKVVGGVEQQRQSPAWSPISVTQEQMIGGITPYKNYLESSGGTKGGYKNYLK